MTTTVFNTKISEVENKIPNNSHLVTTPVLNTKIVKLKFIEITLRHGCLLVNLLHIFRTPFLKNSDGCF